VGKLLRVHGNYFDSGLVGNVLMVIYASEDVAGNSPYEVLHRLHGSHMATTFEQTHISKLTPSNPATTASAERFFQPS
jgi:hypothetical protein